MEHVALIIVDNFLVPRNKGFRHTVFPTKHGYHMCIITCAPLRWPNQCWTWLSSLVFSARGDRRLLWHVETWLVLRHPAMLHASPAHEVRVWKFRCSTRADSHFEGTFPPCKGKHPKFLDPGFSMVWILTLRESAL